MCSASITMAAPPELAPCVSSLWWSANAGGPADADEHVLPTGQMHLVLRLSGPPVQLWPGTDGAAPQTLHGPLLGGARSHYYRKRASTTGTAMGALLGPGAAMALFGVDAGELAHGHTPLADLWGPDAQRLQEQILAARGPCAQLAVLTAFLSRRLAHTRPPPEPVRQALAMLRQGQSVAQAVGRSGYSHRALLAQFRQATGLTPKALTQVWRMQHTLEALRSDAATSLAELAHDCGFSDQAHLTRAFRAYAGVTPQHYRRLAPRHGNHIVLAGAAGQISSIRRDTAALSCALPATTGASHGS